MIRKAVLIALGVVSGAAMMALSAPSYSDGPRSEYGVTPQIIQMDEYLQQGWIIPEDEPAVAESNADSTTGVAGRRADDMADEGPAGPGLGLEQGYDSDVFVSP